MQRPGEDLSHTGQRRPRGLQRLLRLTIAQHGYTPGVYSEPGTWASIFGTGSAASIPNVDEWTYEPETANLGAAPTGWCLKGTSSCAQFFGGVTRSSPHALMWQWSGGGGVRNPYGDFDQINVTTVR